MQLTFRFIDLPFKFVCNRRPQYSHLLDQRIFRFAVNNRQILQYACHVLHTEPGHNEHFDNGKEQGSQQHDEAFFRPCLALQIE